ncbi:reverse transcriptase [Senna tora]|uniref:Reverse transcriptase n=1 Tax=Senna tora TaxID=362788 RepID=A0A834SWF4_9FABA|nr:reverse transcriptase [Senna tora]
MGRKHRDFQKIVERIESRIDSWKTKFLSFSGRATLIKAVTSSIAAYYMSVLPFPVGICNEIDRLHRDFLWGHDRERRKIHLVNWRDICLPKSQGGLGIPKSRERNLAFLAKLFWRSQTEKSKPWARICETNLNLSVGRRTIISQGLIMGKEVVRRGSRINIFSGKDTKFWVQHWCKGGILREAISGPLNFREDCLTVSDVAASIGTWDWSQISFELPTPMRNEIAGTLVDGSSDKSDTSVWQFNSKGSPDVKSAYRMMLDYSKGPNAHNLGWIWKIKVHTRVTFFLWLLLRNAIPTKSLLNSRGIDIPNECPLCLSGPESSEHLFKLCRVTTQSEPIPGHYFCLLSVVYLVC